MIPTAAFDTLAGQYDARFTESPVGRLLRRRVWRWLDRAFAPGTRVLELGCGTGADAVHLAERGVSVLATDASPAMLDVAHAKVEYRRLEGAVELRRLPIERLDTLLPGLSGSFDGAFSNFGALNCVADLTRVAGALVQLLKVGAPVIVCVMGPVVPWEWAWFLARGDMRSAARRIAYRDGIEWNGLTVRYPTIRALRRAFRPRFRVVRSGGLGVLVPPTYAAAWVRGRSRVLERLNRWEREVESWPLVPWLGDHYLLELVRG